jgi:hypothetical protein
MEAFDMPRRAVGVSGVTNGDTTGAGVAIGRIVDSRDSRREGEWPPSAGVARIVRTVRTGVNIRISLHERGAALMRSEEAIEKEHELKQIAVLYEPI